VWVCVRGGWGRGLEGGGAGALKADVEDEAKNWGKILSMLEAGWWNPLVDTLDPTEVWASAGQLQPIDWRPVPPLTPQLNATAATAATPPQ
jgi:hypothetical protein